MNNIRTTYKGNEVKDGFVLVNGKIDLELSKEYTRHITYLRKEAEREERAKKHNWWEM